MGVTLTLISFQQFATSQGGECLTTHYIPGKTQVIRFQCSRGHIWTASPYHFKKWCGECNRESKKLAYFANVQTIARSKGGSCLSKDYVNCFTRLKFRCREGHRWLATPSDIKKGSWCAECYQTSRRDTIEHMHEIAAQRRGKCLSQVYINQSTPLEWECEHGHRWWSRPVVIVTEHWCPECGEVVPWTIDELRKVAWDRGGELLTTQYLNSKTKLKWRCHEGHEFEASANSVVRENGSWCPACYHIRAGWNKAA